MAGDNVAISAGLALINLIKAIIELMKTALDYKTGDWKGKINELENKIKSNEQKIKNQEGDIGKLQKENNDMKKEQDKYKRYVDNANKVQGNFDKMTNEPGNVTILNIIKEASKGKDTLTKKDIINIATDKLLNKAINGLEIDDKDKENFRKKIKKAVKRTMPHEVPDNVHQALSQIDQHHPYNAATINQYINVNINNPNVDQNTLQGVQDIQQAYQDGRAVLRNGVQVQTDAQQMTYGKDLGKSKSMTMTFGGKSAAGTQQKSAVAHDEAK